MSIGKEFDCHQRWSVIKSTHSWVNDDKTPDIFQSQIWSPPPQTGGHSKIRAQYLSFISWIVSFF